MALLLGAVRDPLGHRALPLAAARAMGKVAVGIPENHSLAAGVPVLEQRSSSCVGHSHAVAIWASLAASGKPLGWLPSPAHVYRVARCLDRLGDVLGGYIPPLTDDGCMPSSAIMALGLWGIRPSSVPGASDDDPAVVNREPMLGELIASDARLVLGPYRVDWRKATFCGDVASSIAAGYPVTLTLSVGSRFGDWTPSMGPLTDRDADIDNADPEGGLHSVCVVGYRRASGGRFEFDILNSWGPGFGANGIAVASDTYLAHAVDAYAIEAEVIER